MVEEVKPRFTLQTAASLLAKPEPQLEWLIENVWIDKARGLIAGNPGVGKTWIALDMLISVASGKLCLARYPVKQGAVLLVEEEASELNLARRLHALARARQLQDSDLANLFLLTRQFTKIPADSVELFHLIMEHDIQLVVFDSFRRIHSADENSSTEMQTVLDSLARLNVTTGAAIVLIHHLSKSNEFANKPLFERLRGSSDLWAWRDCILGIEGEEEADECTCSFQFRDAEAQEPILIKRCVGATSGAIGLEASNLEETAEFSDKKEEILSFMRSRVESSTKEAVFKAVKGSRNEFYRVFKALIRNGLVVKNGSGWTVLNSSGTAEYTST